MNLEKAKKKCSQEKLKYDFNCWKFINVMFWYRSPIICNLLLRHIWNRLQDIPATKSVFLNKGVKNNVPSSLSNHLRISHQTLIML